MNDWFKTSFRRNLVDMHIEDWDDSFLSKLDAREYFERLKNANVQSAMIYANSHVGYSYNPTRHGHMHRGLKGKDFFGEITNLCNQAGIDVIAYYTLIFVNWPYEEYPDWRIRTADGRGSRDLRGPFLFNGRYGMCCPNNLEYREFVKDQVEEILDNYQVKGIFYDMIFWPMVCYCDSCKARYFQETGFEIPKMIDINDINWLTFAQKRQEWLLEFAMFARGLVKNKYPELTVEHNASTVMTDAVDFSAGDNYGSMEQQNLTAKFMRNVSPNLPFEFMASRCHPNLFSHTSIKPKNMLTLESYIALANGGAAFFIDAINPDGTLNQKTYEIMGQIYGETQRYEDYWGGKGLADVAVYYCGNMIDAIPKTPVSTDFILSNLTMDAAFHNSEHTVYSVAATRILRENHIPYTVIGKQNVDNLDEYQVMVMCSLPYISDDIIEKIIGWVKKGGCLYISGDAYQIISRLFEVQYESPSDETATYISVTESGRFLVNGTTNEEDPVSILKPITRVKLKSDVDVLAKIVYPYTRSENPSKFATIHASPPGIYTDYPCIVHGKVGEGSVVWSAVNLETKDTALETQNKMFVNIIDKLISKPLYFKSKCNPYVDIVISRQSEMNRDLVCFVNLQNNMPIIEVDDASVTIRLDEKTVKNVFLLPEKTPLEYTVNNDSLTFSVGKLEIHKAAIVEYE